MKRSAGVLMPISSLPSEYGIGCFSSEAYRFVDLLTAAGQSFWQILPLCPTSYGDSPYQSPCSFAGNPYFISPEDLVNEGLLKTDECRRYSSDTPDGRVDYGDLYENRYQLLRTAFRRFSQSEKPSDYYRFIEKNRLWLDDYALFSAIKSSSPGTPLSEWESPIKKRDPSALASVRKELCSEIDFQIFLQYKFFEQWNKLKEYANAKGIKILGDIPIYVSSDSCEVWTRPELFLLDDTLTPTSVAGCPPDAFTPKGQLWGNPIYDWEKHRSESFEWWRLRFLHAMSIYDMIRIDHFRGFESFYSIPYGSPDATNGEWHKGIGIELFDSVRDIIDPDKVVAEDLGYITEEVRNLVRNCGFYGMKILEFGFEGNEDFNSEYIPHNYNERSVVYTGTHDNPPLMQWLSSLSDTDRSSLERYLLTDNAKDSEICDRLIAIAMQSVSLLCVVPLQDYLGLGEYGRLNIPSSASGNWSWRATKDDLNNDLCNRILEFTKISGRSSIKAD